MNKSKSNIKKRFEEVIYDIEVIFEEHFEKSDYRRSELSKLGKEELKQTISKEIDKAYKRGYKDGKEEWSQDEEGVARGV